MNDNNTEAKKIYHTQDDPEFQRPCIDIREKRNRELEDGSSVSYQYLHGRFEGTDVKFSCCFPEKEHFAWRFFQHLSPFPGPDEELAALDKTGENDFIAFAITHGACYVESNMGSKAIFGGMGDPTIIYRSSAAVAQFCRKAAQEMYGAHRVYGYVFGGSGGGYKTMSCIENTDAFDGALPFVIGSPVSLPNCLTVSAHGARLLRNCWSSITDALEPGGSGDPYKGLTQTEADALREITNMGYPQRMCIGFKTEDDGALPVLAPAVHEMDPDYFTDFWTKKGYLGADPDGSAVRDRIHMEVTVEMAGIPQEEQKAQTIDGRNGTDTAWQKMLTDASAAFIQVNEVPEKDNLFLRGVDMLIESGKAKGKKLHLGRIEGKCLIPGMSFGTDEYKEVIRMLRKGDRILLDNSDYIAIQTYHRHQIPDDRTFHAWDQYLDAEGKPVYPQRDKVISYGFTTGGCGSVQDGQIQGKVIVMNSLMDTDFPWQADWYRRKVEEVKKQEAPQCFRLWYNDNCPHGDESETGDHTRLVSYLGMLRQGLLDLAAWTEQGISPADSTGYRLMNNQVVPEESAADRKGIQPVVSLFVQENVCAHVSAESRVHFTAQADGTAACGKLEKAEFCFGEDDSFSEAGTVTRQWEENGITHALIEAEHVYHKAGTFFPVVRIITNRQKGDSFTRLRNLCRARVIVNDAEGNKADEK